MPKETILRPHTKPVAEKRMPQQNIQGCVKSKASMRNRSAGYICRDELVLLAVLKEQLNPCMQSWTVPLICISASSISLTRKEFSLLILVFGRTERPLHSAHITNSFLIYLLFINNLRLPALHHCSSLPRHAFISEFDLCWDTSPKASEENKGSVLCPVHGVGGWGNSSLKPHMDV